MKKILKFVTLVAGVRFLVKILSENVDVKVQIEKLRDETSVMLVAGDWYGMDNYVRFGYGAKSADLKEALDRISPVLKTL